MRLLRYAAVTLALALSGGLLSTPAGASSARSVIITRKEYGKRWPFTVPSGLLACSAPGAVTFRAKGVTYAVNGTAKMLKRGADIRRIWRDDPAYPGLKVNIGPIIDRGLRLC